MILFGGHDTQGLRRHLHLIMISMLLLGGIGSRSIDEGRENRASADGILEAMTPEEKVGQLFLVAFEGSSIGKEDEIVDLIEYHHISGVVLKAENGNFVDAPDTLSTLRSLAISLQETEYQASREPILIDAESGELRQPTYIPLFIATEHDGGGTPDEEIIIGLSDLPSQMALGATWDPSLAEVVGEVLGRELSALGINLVLGPSLDVVQDPRLSDPGNLGVRTFGGDPFWVGEMAKEYISGIHQGSKGKLAVIAKNFPGIGSSDRPPQEEVATIRKSLNELMQIDLPPFFAVTRQAPGEGNSIADGLLTSHIRYQGFQGNIRATTRPVSLDSQALGDLMGMEQFALWREGGGIVVSDSLGSRAVRRFYDPLEESFNPHLVARDAFLAGNDLLMLTNFQGSDDPDELTSIKATLEFFAQKYREDPIFAEKVDNSVRKILELKLRISGGVFSAYRAIPREEDLSAIGQSQDITYDVATRSATLVFPSAEELAERLGEPPKLGERIVFFTDDRRIKQCSTCEPVPAIDVSTLEQTVLQLYGYQGAGQVGLWTLSSFSLADLAFYLHEEVPEGYSQLFAPPEEIEPAIEAADWLVFSVLKDTEAEYGSNALKLMLERRPDLAQQKKVVVFAYDVPYDFDATDFSKVDAYYALYSKSPPFIDVAARILFQEMTPEGAAPVNIPGVDYNLIEALAPDPQQIISLSLRGGGEGEAITEPAEGYGVGDLIHVETGIIRDTNGHQIPDGTLVDFYFWYQGDAAPHLELKAATVGGIAKADVTLDRIGLLTIGAESDPARTSELLQLNVKEGVPAFVTVIAPTQLPTQAPGPTETPSGNLLSTNASATSMPIVGGKRAQGMGLRDLSYSLLSLISIAGLVIYGRRRWKVLNRDREPTLVLSSIVSGLMGYDYVALSLPGSEAAIRWMGAGAGIAGAVLGSMIGLGIVLLLLMGKGGKNSA